MAMSKRRAVGVFCRSVDAIDGSRHDRSCSQRFEGCVSTLTFLWSPFSHGIAGAMLVRFGVLFSRSGVPSTVEAPG